MIIYGKNSVGKSNLGLAIFDIVSHLTDKNVTPSLYDYYLNSDGYESVTFKYDFVFNDDLIEYCYTKDKKRVLLTEQISLNDGSTILLKAHKTPLVSLKPVKLSRRLLEAV